MSDRYVEKNGSVFGEKQSTQISSGQTSAGRIIALNDDGFLDASLFNPEEGETKFVLTECFGFIFTESGQRIVL